MKYEYKPTPTKHSLLDKEQEHDLIRKAQAGDKSAADSLIQHNQRLIHTVAIRLKGYGVPVEDLVQQGNIGIYDAINRFDLTRGDCRFSTVAVNYIKNPMLQYIFANRRIYGIPLGGSACKLFFNMRKYVNSPGEMTNAKIEAMQQELNVPRGTIVIIGDYLFGSDVPLTAPDNFNEGEENFGYNIETLVDDGEGPMDLLISEEQADYANEVTSRCMSVLTPMELDIIKSRVIADKKEQLATIGERYGKSGERIRQIQAAAIEKMRKCIKA